MEDGWSLTCHDLYNRADFFVCVGAIEAQAQCLRGAGAPCLK